MHAQESGPEQPASHLREAQVVLAPRSRREAEVAVMRAVRVGEGARWGVRRRVGTMMARRTKAGLSGSTKR